MAFRSVVVPNAASWLERPPQLRPPFRSHSRISRMRCHHRQLGGEAGLAEFGEAVVAVLAHEFAEFGA